MAKPDCFISQSRFDKLKIELNKLKNMSRPQAIEEVKRLAMMGDFSENFAYQIAKGRLRGINHRILIIEAELQRAQIIHIDSTERVQIGHTVTIEFKGSKKTYQILGSAETDPTSGKISHNSPLGNALVGHRVGEKVLVHQGDRSKEYTILKIDWGNVRADN